MNLTNNKIGLLLVSTSILPFVGGIVYHMNPAGELTGGPDLGLCPVREYLGIPCALCGASRSFVLLMSGNANWLLYNPWWVVVFTALLAVGVLMFIPHQASKIKNFIVSKSRTQLFIYFYLVVLVGWATAWINFSRVIPN